MADFNHIEQLVWSMLEDMGIDLEYDKEKSEICDKYLKYIKDRINEDYNNTL